MHGSIARHHVHYRVGSRSPAAAALLPAIDRAIQQALASAIERRLDHALGDGGEVIVIREATANVVLQARDCALTSAIVDRVSASAADAVVSVAASPADSDAVMRFASETAFVGSFIAEVLAGTAHERWFFGPLHRYARDTPAETIAAVLADHDADEILRWLKGHGHKLPAAVPCSGTGVLPGDGVTSPRTAATRDTAPLASAALQILGAIGWDVSPASWPELCARFVAANPAAPDWRNTRSLTSWVIGLIGCVTAATAEVRSRRRIDPAAAESLLQDTLDWLDVPLVRTAVTSLAAQCRDVEPTSPHIAAMPADARSSAIIARVVALIEEQVRGGSWTRPPANANEVARSLVASIADPDRHVTVEDVALIARIESIVGACFRLIAERTRRVMPAPASRPGMSSTPASRPVSAEVRKAIATLTDAGPAAAPLLRHLIASAADAAAGELTSWGGLFLLTRPVMDVKLPVLARDAAIPLGSVLSIVARTLLSADPPFDGPTRFWIGSDDPDVMGCALDDERLDRLRLSLEALLFEQHLRAASLTDDATHPRLVMLLVRAWARWLPALHDASVDFLVRNCLSRAARVRVTEAAVHVAFDPAPLDVVLEMAGCFRPIDTVAWLGGRRMTFVVGQQGASQAS